jgi:hypothetical protein
MGQRHGGAYGFIENGHAVVLGEGGDQASHHLDGSSLLGLRDEQRLEAPGQRGILLDMALVLAPSGCPHRAQGSTRKSRLEQIRGITGAGRSTCADQGVHLVDEKNDGLSRLSRFFEQRLQARLELASHAGAGQQCPHIEAQQTRVFEVRRHVTTGDCQSEPLDDGCLAYAGLACEQGVVLPPTQQDVDHGANFMLAPDDRIDLPAARALGQVGAVPGQCGFVIGLIGDGAAGLSGHGRRQAGAVVWPFLLFRRPGDDLGDGIRQLVGGNFLKCRRDAEQHAPQFRRLHQGCEQPATAHTAITEFKARQHPGALDGHLDVMREVDQRRGARGQTEQGGGQVFLDGLRVDLVVAADTMQVAVVELPELMDPVRQLDVRVASEPRKSCRGFDAAKQGEIELAEQRPPGNRHATISRAT